MSNASKQPDSPVNDPYIRVRGARQHNLKNVDLIIPRDALVVFTGVSGSGKSSLAFGTLYAEAQRRYLESVSPYARRLFNQMAVPEVDSIEGLPPAIALQQQRGQPTTRSSVGSVTTLSNLVRMLYSRAGQYPPGLGILYAESFSPNTPQGACPTCQGTGMIYSVTDQSMVPDPSLTIRQRAIAAWPQAWGGQNLRDILVSLGYDVDRPWRDLPKEQRDWILFTDEQPVVPVYPGYTPDQTQRAIKRKEPPDYMGTFSSARRHVLYTFANTQSQQMKKRVSAYMLHTPCPTCHGKRLQTDSLRVTFAGLDIADFSELPLNRLTNLLQPYADGERIRSHDKTPPEQAEVIRRITADLVARLTVLLDLGLGYLSLERSTPTLSPGELQRLRLATQLYSTLFGVVYVLDEPSAGLHPSDTEALLAALAGLKRAGNSLFVVEHNLDVVRQADWLVDVGPAAGVQGGEVLYSGPPAGLADVASSQTRPYLFETGPANTDHTVRIPTGYLRLTNVSRNNLHALNVSIPLGTLTTVTGVSGSGKSTLVSQVLVELVATHLGQTLPTDDEDTLDERSPVTTSGQLGGDVQRIKRLVQVDQKPIGRTPRSNMATYTGLFDNVRKLFAATPAAQKAGYDAGQFSFNVAKGRCPHCQGEGFVMVELLFLPSVYSPCPVCQGARYNEQTLTITYRDKTIADVLNMTVDIAIEFFKDEPTVRRALTALHDVGLGYLRLGQPATELSGGEAQRIKLATELQRTNNGATLYILDEPTTGLHPADVDRLLIQLNSLVDGGNTVVVVEHTMRVVAASDQVIDMGPGAGDEGGQVVAQGTPSDIANHPDSRTAPYLKRYMK
jgi:excinuclease ABC subunit A